MRRQIAIVRKMDNSWDRRQLQPRADLAAKLRVHPDGVRLPASFLRTDWALKDKPYLYPDCLHSAERVCDAFLLDVNGDGRPEVLLFQLAKPDGKARQGRDDNLVLTEDAQGGWTAYATLSMPNLVCKEVGERLAAGKLTALAPALADIGIGGERGHLNLVDSGVQCRKQDAD